LLSPTFDENEIAIYCTKRKQRLAVERSKPTFQAREIFSQSIFGPEHPYGVSYPESYYDDVTRERLVEFYERHYTAENCFVVCSGKLDASTIDAIAALAGDIPTGGDTVSGDFPAPHSIFSKYKKYDGAVQSAIRIGKLLFTRNHPDFVPMQVVTTILGGYFGSRLVHNLREVHGYTYGVYSAMVNLEHAGYMAIATEIATDATEDALEQIFAETERLRNELVDGRELDMVRNIMIGEIMRILDGPFGIADVTIENIQNGTGNDYLDRFLDSVRTITPEQVRDTAAKYLDRDSFTTVIVGDDPSGGTFGLEK
jgi:zinc protease